MALPVIPKKDPRPVARTFKLSEKSADWLKRASRDHNMSQADVIEHLIQQEMKSGPHKKSR